MTLKSANVGQGFACGALESAKSGQGLSQFLVPNPQKSGQARKSFGDAAVRDFSQIYSQKLAEAVPHANIAQPKLRGGFAVPKPCAEINIRIRKVSNRNNKSIEVKYDPPMIAYGVDRPWADVESNITQWLDGVYSKNFGYRIEEREEYALYYAQGKCVLDDFNSESKVGNVWRAATKRPGVLVTAANTKSLILEIDILVNYPPCDSDGDDVQTTVGMKRKAKASMSVSTALRPFKKAGIGAYDTLITRAENHGAKSNEETFIIQKLEVGMSADDEWVKLSAKSKVFVEKVEFQGGTTKKAFKLRFEDAPRKVYAAKCFFHDGSTHDLPPTDEENLAYLKEELLRQVAINQAIKHFIKAAKQAKVGIYDISTADACIIVVSEGDQEGKAWLIDPLLDSRKMRKFSGTEVAGSNTDFPGRTCDAFAHFVLDDSSEFVPVDIQGIETDKIIENGLRGSSVLTLFDVMAHSKDSTMGLGDLGITGIEQFCDQHTCNPICNKLILTNCADLLREIKGLPQCDKEASNGIEGGQNSEIDQLDSDQ